MKGKITVRKCINEDHRHGTRTLLKTNFFLCSVMHAKWDEMSRAKETRVTKRAEQHRNNEIDFTHGTTAGKAN